MGNFNSKYESYYSSIVNRRNTGGYYNGISNKHQKQLTGNRIIKKLIQDLCGVLIMFIFVITCKTIVTPRTTTAYNYCKNVVNKNYDYKKIITTIKEEGKTENFQDRIINIIEKIKTKFTGEETIKNMIKDKFQLPVEGKIMSSTKQGVDIESPNRVDIKASYDGTVKQCGIDEKYGKYIVIDHGQGLETKYSNLENIVVKREDKVGKGQIIAKASGSNSNEVVHFEILFMGQNKGLEKNVEMK